MLKTLYVPECGRPARDPVSMLRSCLAMMECGQTSFDEWVGQMRDEPFYALISGFEPSNVPGVGTFYDFQDRLLKRKRQARSHLRRPYQRRDERDQAATHQEKNNLSPHAGIINRLTERILGRPYAPTAVAELLAGQSTLATLSPGSRCCNGSSTAASWPTQSSWACSTWTISSHMEMEPNYRLGPILLARNCVTATIEGRNQTNAAAAIGPNDPMPFGAG
ncbi:hypothetical protein KFU94_48060 [Chloroflexi bacterium TSY]|nr:hypothetical protein [Chloroflexi bacterium TSY]